VASSTLSIGSPSLVDSARTSATKDRKCNTRHQLKWSKPERSRNLMACNNRTKVAISFNANASSFMGVIVQPHLSVIAQARDWMRQDGIGVVDLGQSVIGENGVRVLVGMIMLGQATISGLDNVSTGVRTDLQDFIKCVFTFH
jgi:hypothetical protein